MTERYKKILTMLKLSGGEIWGRKRFQKMVYILKVKGASFAEDFTYHYYGPYSSELQLEIDNLVETGLLQEDEPDAGINCYIYRSASDIKESAEIAHYNKIISLLKSKTTDVLELTSTLYYLIDSGITDHSMLRKKLIALKPSLEKNLDAAFHLHDEIESSLN